MEEIKLSKRAVMLKPSPTLALAARAKQMKKEGADIISLSVGEPDWDTYQFIKDEGVKALANGETKYLPASGLMELKEAICLQLREQNSFEFTTDEVTVSTGAKFILFSALQMLLEEGDEAIIPAPYWVSYPTMVELTGATPVIVECCKKTSYKLTAEKLEEAITNKTKVLILNSPSNPTGEIYSLEELKSLTAVLEKNPQITIISDDIYNQLVFSGEGSAPHMLSVSEKLKNQTLLVNGVSKTYSMTGWRVGWGVGPKKLISAMTKFQSQSVSCASSISQRAAVAAIEKGADFVKESNKTLVSRAKKATSLLNEISGVSVAQPNGAFYLWVDISSFLGKSYLGKKIDSSRSLSEFILENEKVAVVPGLEFGLEGFLRVSYAINEEKMVEAVTRLSRFFSVVN